MSEKNYVSWHFTNIYPTAKIGEGTIIGSYVEIGNNVKIGKNCHIEAFTFIPEGVTIEDHVFIGPHVVFTNDKKPPSYGEYWMQTIVKTSASIGANSTILPGLIIGEKAIIGSGSVVVNSVPAGTTVVGNPAHFLKPKKF